jgi:hypothetical protein
MDTGFSSKLKDMLEIKRLRDEAALCRRLAGGALPFTVAQDLERLASEYDHRAAALEAGYCAPRAA